MSTGDESRLVDGETRLFGIIGHPIAQVKSPELLTRRLRNAGRNAILVPIHVRPEHFQESVRGLMALDNLDGLVVTVPYKAAILPFVDHLLPTGAAVGAINAMRRDSDGRWTGDMFDGKGLVRSLREQGHGLVGKRAIVLGAGGAGSAIAMAFADAGVSEIAIYDLDGGKAFALGRRIAAAFPACSLATGSTSLEGRDILVNATPIGMAPGDGLPISLGALDPRLLVIEVIMKPEVTPLLLHAWNCGCRTVAGSAVLGGQAEELMRFFRIVA